MRRADVAALPMGIYRLHWIDGSSSIAAVGIAWNGERWIAPLNWCEPVADGPGVAQAWLKVGRAELVVSVKTMSPGAPAAYQDISAIHELVPVTPRPLAPMAAPRGRAPEPLAAAFRVLKKHHSQRAPRAGRYTAQRRPSDA